MWPIYKRNTVRRLKYVVTIVVNLNSNGIDCILPTQSKCFVSIIRNMGKFHLKIVWEMCGSKNGFVGDILNSQQL